MVHKCIKCNFIHEGEFPDGYLCPLCYANVFDFRLIETEEKIYNRIEISKDNPGINRIEEKCTNCGACRNTCENIVGIKYDAKEICITCGRCVLTCPTGALTPKYDYNLVWELINIPEKTVVVMTSPAVRVGIGDAFGFEPGKFLEGKMIAALKTLGFNHVFDTSFGADLTGIQEATELSNRIKNKSKLPLFTSCCPAWVKYVNNYHPKLTKNISSCKSPIAMQTSVLREIFAKEEELNDQDLVIVALTPCTAKKEEIINSGCDYVITTSELALLLREQNIDFKNLADQEFDNLIGSSSGINFGASGGVMLSALRTFYYQETGKNLTDDKLLVQKKDFYTEYSFKIKSEHFKCAVVSNMFNLEKLLPIKNEFIFIEVMNCQGGCINGGGQIIMPIKDMPDIIKQRQKSLVNYDQKSKLKYPYLNPIVKELYEEYLDEPISEKAKGLLHKD